MPTDILKALKQLEQLITFERAVCVVGLALFAAWLLRTSLGRKALAASKPRRTNMPPYIPLLVLVVWLSSAAAIRAAAVAAFGRLSDLNAYLRDSVIQGVVAILVAALITLIAAATFARRLKGFGLNPKTIGKDFAAALLSLLAVWPLILAMVLLTAFLGKLLYGPQFEMQPHEALKLVTESTSTSLQVAICLLAVAAAPLMEELLFRGLFQTVIRSYVLRPWPAIIASSLVFTSVHTDIAHWPTLLVLALCLGYAYEKSGSLFRPIFIHALFNGITIAAALTQR